MIMRVTKIIRAALSELHDRARVTYLLWQLLRMEEEEETHQNLSLPTFNLPLSPISS